MRLTSRIILLLETFSISVILICTVVTHVVCVCLCFIPTIPTVQLAVAYLTLARSTFLNLPVQSNSFYQNYDCLQWKELLVHVRKLTYQGLYLPQLQKGNRPLFEECLYQRQAFIHNYLCLIHYWFSLCCTLCLGSM